MNSMFIARPGAETKRDQTSRDNKRRTRLGPAPFVASTFDLVSAGAESAEGLLG